MCIRDRFKQKHNSNQALNDSLLTFQKILVWEIHTDYHWSLDNQFIKNDKVYDFFFLHTFSFNYDIWWRQWAMTLMFVMDLCSQLHSVYMVKYLGKLL